MISSLRQIARALSVQENLSATLEQTVFQTTDVLQVDSCSIYLLDRDQQTLRLQASSGLSRDVFGVATLKVGEGMTGQAVTQGVPVYADTAVSSPFFKPVLGTGEQAYESLLAVPLTVEKTVIGALNVQTIERHFYTDEEIELLSFIGDLAAGAVYKAQLYERQKQQLEELQALADVSAAVTSPQYLDDMLDVVTDMAARVLNASICSIFLMDENGKFLDLRSAKRGSNRYRQRPPHPVEEGVIGYVARTGRDVIIPDVRTDPRYSGQDLAKDEGLVSMLAVPLSVRDRVIGVMACYTGQLRRFSDQQKALLTTLANQTALAIENAQLVTNAAVVREMHHRIKNNLQNVAMLMRLQMSEAHRLNTKELIEMSISRIQSIAAVHEILSERGFNMVDVASVIQRIVDGVMMAPSQSFKIRVEGESLTLPSRQATSLALAVNELVQNAIEHGFAGRGKGEVVITISHVPDGVLISVRDNGHGIPSDFDQNLGLELVGMLIGEDLKGEIHYHRLAVGTEVKILLPPEVIKPVESVSPKFD
ncbi:MAG: GAF domain-containing protein [Chloroflexota bacterium]